MDGVASFIHDWTPHSTLTLFAASCAVFIVAVLWVSIGRRSHGGSMTMEDYWRVGFAAGPIPIYLLLPLAPFDRDLATALLDQPFQLLLAAAAAMMWTVTDIRLLVSKKPTHPK